MMVWHFLVNAPISRYDKPVIYYFKPGSSTSQLAYDLQSHGVLDKPKLFMRYLTIHGLTRRCQAGYYQVDPDETIASLAKKFAEGDILKYDFTIVEGWTLRELEKKLLSAKGLTTKAFNETVKALVKGDKQGKNPDSPEGLFLPETYRYPHGAQGETILNRAHDSLIATAEAYWQERDKSLPFTSWYEALIVASLVEKETMIEEERAIIAGVIMNRLRLNMPLQIDASVIYGLGDHFDGDIKRHHLRTPTPYNTYTQRGLPPTPISLPSKRSLYAAMHPSKTDYLYFVATGDGGHAFSKTLDAHNRAVKRYILDPIRSH